MFYVHSLYAKRHGIFNVLPESSIQFYICFFFSHLRGR